MLVKTAAADKQEVHKSGDDVDGTRHHGQAVQIDINDDDAVTNAHGEKNTQYLVKAGVSPHRLVQPHEMVNGYFYDHNDNRHTRVYLQLMKWHVFAVAQIVGENGGEVYEDAVGYIGEEAL